MDYLASRQQGPESPATSASHLVRRGSVDLTVFTGPVIFERAGTRPSFIAPAVASGLVSGPSRPRTFGDELRAAADPESAERILSLRSTQPPR